MLPCCVCVCPEGYQLDLSAHHKRELHESELVLAAQGRKVDDLHRAVEDWRTRYEQDMQELRQRAAQRETEHAVEVEQLQEDLNALLDFRKEKVRKDMDQCLMPSARRMC